MTKTELLQQALDQLLAEIPELDGAMVASSDGVPLASVWSEGSDPKHMAVIAAIALGMSHRVGDALGIGDPCEVSLSCRDGQVHLYVAGCKGVLAVVAPVGTSIGHLRLKAREQADRIVEIL